jgi:hypothetical protein
LGVVPLGRRSVLISQVQVAGGTSCTRAKLRAMRRLLLLPVIGLLVACGGPRQIVQTTSSNDVKPIEAEELRRAIDGFGERILIRTVNLADALDAQASSSQLKRRTLNWRLRTADKVFSAQHQANNLIALIELWVWTAMVDHTIQASDSTTALGDLAQQARDMSAQLRAEAANLATRALPPELVARLKTDIDKAIEHGDLFTANAAEQQALFDQFLSASRLESLLKLPLAPFNAFGGVSQGAEAVGKLAITADRAVDVLEKYPQTLQWRMHLIALDLEELDTTRAVVANLRSLDATAKALPQTLREQAEILLNTSELPQLTAQKTLQEVRLASNSLGDTLHAADETIARLDAFIAGFASPPDAPPKPPGEPFHIQDYAATAVAVESTLHELRAALADLQQPALAARAREATATVIDQLGLRLAQLIGLATIAGLVLIAAARWRRK